MRCIHSFIHFTHPDHANVTRSVAVAPGEPVPVVPPGDVRITNIALGEELADESARTTVKLMYRTPGASEESDEEDDEEDEEEDVEIETTVLCSLIPSKVYTFLVSHGHLKTLSVID